MLKDKTVMDIISFVNSFIQNNMPKGQGGTLTDQEAADLAAFYFPMNALSQIPMLSAITTKIRTEII